MTCGHKELMARERVCDWCCEVVGSCWLLRRWAVDVGSSTHDSFTTCFVVDTSGCCWGCECWSNHTRASRTTSLQRDWLRALTGMLRWPSSLLLLTHVTWLLRGDELVGAIYFIVSNSVAH
jgi:hypothetical protein